MADEGKGLLDRIGDHQRPGPRAPLAASDADRLRVIFAASARKSPISTDLRTRARSASTDGKGAAKRRAALRRRRSLRRSARSTSRLASGARQADEAGALAAAHRKFGQRQARAPRRGRPWRSAASSEAKAIEARAVEPDPDRVRGFPLALAHEGAVLARRAAPIDARRRLAGHEGAELPEGLARPGPPAPVHAVQQAVGDLPRGDDEAGQPRGKRRRLLADAAVSERLPAPSAQRERLGDEAGDRRPETVSPSARAAIGQRHAMLEHRLGERGDVVARGREAAVDQRAGAAGEHERLRGARARPPGDRPR